MRPTTATRPVPTTVLIALTLALAVAGLAAPPGATAVAADAAGTKVLSGTILGRDGRAVNALIGFDVLDRRGRFIDLNGRAGYSAYLIVNPTASDQGERRRPGTSWQVAWSLRLPANADHVFIEAYAKSPHPRNPHIQTATPDSRRRYGLAMRRPIPANAHGVNIRLPLVCGRGGNTGGIKGRVTRHGRLLQPTSADAWSAAPDSNTRIMSWNLAVGLPAGHLYQGRYNYVLPYLLPGQPYDLWITAGGVTKKLRVRDVAPCRGTVVNVAF